MTKHSTTTSTNETLILSGLTEQPQRPDRHRGPGLTPPHRVAADHRRSRRS